MLARHTVKMMHAHRFGVKAAPQAGRKGLS